MPRISQDEGERGRLLEGGYVVLTPKGCGHMLSID
jgi:hypothetical protein